jgi:fucose 4-O-acetylase-like acetyltransferase
LTHNTPLWFLTCLFVVELMYWALQRSLPSRRLVMLGIVACSATGYWLGRYCPVRWPWGADVALSAVLFYGAGNLSWPMLEAYSRSPRRKRGLINLAAVILGTAGMWWGFGFVNMSENILGPGYLQFYAAAFGGIAVSIVVAQSVPSNRLIRLLGRNTLVILALQIPCFGLVKALQQYGLGIDVDASRDSLAWGLAHTVAIVGLLIPVIYGIDRWAPFLKGQRRTDLLTPAGGGCVSLLASGRR